MSTTIDNRVDQKGPAYDIEGTAESTNSAAPPEKGDLSSQQDEGTIINSYAAPQSIKEFLRVLTTAGVELRGLEPVPLQDRTHTKYYNIMTLFGGSFISLLPISIGTTPTLVFGLSFSHAAAMISVQFRYVFGKYPNIFFCLIVIVEIGIFGILAAVGGAECLAAIRAGTLPVEGGIGIIMAVALIMAFFGYRAIHLVCQYIWIPNSICILILVGCAAKGLHNQAGVAAPPGIAGPYLSTLAICAGNMATWGTIVGDYSCYMPPTAPRKRLAMYCFLGLYVPFTLMMLFGAAIGGVVTQNATWIAAYEQGSFGAVLGEILTSRVGGFGRFLLVILGFSIVTTSARDMYSISIFVAGVVPWLHRVPRIVLLMLVAGAMVGIGIAASRSFLPALSALVSIAGYITGPTISVFLVEWFLFRKADPSTIDPKIWNNSAALPSGFPALIACSVPWAVIVLSMATTWYVGPIAKAAGDLAYPLGAACSILLYVPLRAFEIKYRGRL
ncbi:Purine-cytosine permease FCY2 [Cyphellophora attinorum]|uniref:Purine-cytosine permease FCY2 n=1 Tax=Cyphellophora attinorum TaxID=1664694 RepID=A0A0N0NR45_9EURO|nr:Purine-cytosine permease FCY2 [Phialophora attinorum]KPI44671.1 Purine-cytosine permease FCY2 [Phialophora attinorum]